MTGKICLTENQVRGWIHYRDRVVLHIASADEVEGDLYDGYSSFAIVETQQLRQMLKEREGDCGANR